MLYGHTIIFIFWKKFLGNWKNIDSFFLNSKKIFPKIDGLNHTLFIILTQEYVYHFYLIFHICSHTRNEIIKAVARNQRNILWKD